MTKEKITAYGLVSGSCSILLMVACYLVKDWKEQVTFATQENTKNLQLQERDIEEVKVQSQDRWERVLERLSQIDERLKILTEKRERQS